jgi:hypothetical protein
MQVSHSNQTALPLGSPFCCQGDVQNTRGRYGTLRARESSLCTGEGVRQRAEEANERTSECKTFSSWGWDVNTHDYSHHAQRAPPTYVEGELTPLHTPTRAAPQSHT